MTIFKVAKKKYFLSPSVKFSFSLKQLLPHSHSIFKHFGMIGENQYCLLEGSSQLEGELLLEFSVIMDKLPVVSDHYSDVGFKSSF